MDGSDYQLVLPSGAVVGHRSLMRYYKQSIDPNRIVPSKNTKKLHKVLSEYKALGWTATQQEAAARYVRFTIKIFVIVSIYILLQKGKRYTLLEKIALQIYNEIRIESKQITKAF